MWDWITGNDDKKRANREFANTSKNNLSNYERIVGELLGTYGDKMEAGIAAGNEKLDALTGQMQNFTPDDIAQWLNPNMQYQIDTATKAVNDNFGKDGQLFSTNAQTALQDRAQNIANMSWQQAAQMGMDVMGRNNANLATQVGLHQNQQGMDTNTLAAILNGNMAFQDNLFNGKQQIAQNSLQAASSMTSPLDALTGFMSGAGNLATGIGKLTGGGK